MCPRPEKTTVTFGADRRILLLTFFNIVRVCFSTFYINFSWNKAQKFIVMVHSGGQT